MDTAKQFEEKLARIYRAVGSNRQSDLARILAIKSPSVAAAYKRQQIPGGWVETIAEKCNVSADWLLFGQGEMRSNEGPTEKVVNDPAPEALEAPTHQIIMVPMVEARLSAGHGSFETDGTSERKYSFRSDFLRRKGKISEMVLMRVAGDSMTPAIEDGDVVLIDQSQNAPRPGSIYAVGVEDVVYLKKFNAEPGKIILSSFNTDYPPFEIDTRGDLEDCVRIIGRVIWSCREW